MPATRLLIEVLDALGLTIVKVVGPLILVHE